MGGPPARPSTRRPRLFYLSAGQWFRNRIRSDDPKLPGAASPRSWAEFIRRQSRLRQADLERRTHLADEYLAVLDKHSDELASVTQRLKAALRERGIEMELDGLQKYDAKSIYQLRDFLKKSPLNSIDGRLRFLSTFRDRLTQFSTSPAGKRATTYDEPISTLPAEDREAIASLRSEGAQVEDIATLYAGQDVPLPIIAHACHSHDLVALVDASPGLTVEGKRLCRELRVQGWSPQKIYDTYFSDIKGLSPISVKSCGEWGLIKKRQSESETVTSH